MLLEKNAQNISDIENLRQQLAELTKENESREVLATKEKNKVSGVQGWMMMMLMKMVVVADQWLLCVSWQRVCLLWRQS